MEVKPGYKQTEVGIVPAEWDVPFLRQHLLQDATYGVVKAGTFQRTGIPMLRGGDIKNGSIIEDQPLITLEKSQEYSRTVLKEKDVVIALVGYPGETAVIPNRLVGANISRAVGLLRPARTLRPEFLACYLNSASGRKEFLRPSAGSAQIVVNLGALNRLRFPLPPLPEQHAISEALSDVDALLGGLDRLIVKKRDLKQAAMRQLLAGQTRLLGFGVTRAVVSDELGTRPQDWDVIPLNELVDPSRGIRYGIVQPGAYDPNGRFMIRGQDYSEAKGWADPSDVFRVSDAVEQRYRSARVQHGDLIMTIVGYCGHVEIVPAWLDGANLTQTTARIAIQPDKASQVFCKYMLQSAVGRSQVASFLKGAAQPGLNCGDVEKFRLPLPTMREQTAIAAVLSDMDAELTALEACRGKTRNLKQAMMQELLTGKTRLVPAGAAHA